MVASRPRNLARQVNEASAVAVHSLSLASLRMTMMKAHPLGRGAGETIWMMRTERKMAATGESATWLLPRDLVELISRFTSPVTLKMALGLLSFIGGTGV
jgi:hypothetical protein